MEKKICRSNDGRMIAGVCTGLGEYFGLDATVFRLAFAILACMGGSGILVYILAALIMPLKPE